MIETFSVPFDGFLTALSLCLKDSSGRGNISMMVQPLYPILAKSKSPK